jgi:hypothetical protein
MKIHHNIYTWLIILTITAFSTKGQEIKPLEKTVTEEVEVIRPYKPVLAEAVKLKRSPDLENIKTYKAKFNYKLNDRKLDLNTNIEKLQAQNLVPQKEKQLLNNYVKGALGSLSTVFAEGYIATDKDEALQAGAFFKHFSQQGTLNKQNNSQQQLNVFGRSIGDKSILSGNLNFQRQDLYFYGIDELNPTLNLNPENQVYNFIELNGEVLNKFSDKKNATSYALKANAYLLSDKFDANEKSLTLTGFFNKRIGILNLGLATSTEIGTTNNATNRLANHLVRLNPYLKFEAKGVKVAAGINFVQEFGNFSGSRIFPAITADFTLIPEYLQIFGEIKGDVNRTTLKNLSDENPFLNQNINIQNSVEKISFSGGVKGTGGPGFGYKAKVYSKQIVDMPLFVNNFSNFNKFDVVYDIGAMHLLGLEGEISVQVNDKLNWIGKINLEDYNPASEIASYFKPQLRLNSNLVYNISEKLSLNASTIIQGVSRAKIFLTDPKLNTLTSSTDQHKIVSVKGFVDLGAGADYKLNKKFGAFVRANNLLNTNNNRFLFYPLNGFNMFGGFSYSF